MVDGEEGYVIRQFVQAYKRNVKQGILLGLIALACSYAVWMDFQLFNAVENNPMVFLIAGIITGFLFFCSLLYVFPQAARYENTIPAMLKNSFRISMKYFGRTLILVIVMMIEIGAFIWNSTTMFIGLLIGPACVIYTISAMAKPIFREIEKDALSGEA
jgi:uncharacterized membrane protein YesL